MSSRSGSTTPMTQTGATATMTINLDKIAMRAYEKWCKRGCPHGSDQRDWYEAEAELKAEIIRTGAMAGASSRR